MIAECGKHALNWNADELAHHVEQDDATRTRLKNWCFGATDCDKAEREERRKIKRAAAARAKRAAAGATPRAQSATATKPWEKKGVSRATYYRNLKKPDRETNTRPATSSSLLPVTHLSHDDSAHKRPKGAAERSDILPAVAAVAMGQAGDATSSIAKPLPSSPSRIRQTIDTVAAGPDTAMTALEYDRLHLQERARLHLNEVVADMMRSDDPASWQPALIAATSEWRGHRLMDDDNPHTLARGVAPFAIGAKGPP